MTPQEVVERAISQGARSIACTYSEPIVFYEYMYDIAVEGRRRGIGTVMISNGYIERQPMNELLSLLNGVKIDLKAFQDRFYRDTCGGALRPVLDTLRLIRQRNVWLEIVVLIVPTLNDSEREIRAMARWLLQELGPDVPLHFSRYHPTYQLTNLPPTPVREIETLRQIALDVGLRYVYLGNVPGHPGEDTECHACHHTLLGRDGYVLRYNRLRDGCCPECGARIPGVWG
jgi:pyruvate formate lyase activating enzyme